MRIKVKLRFCGRKLLGRVVERLGYSMMLQMYPPPEYTVTSWGMTESLRNLFSDEDRRRWDPNVPDGFVFRGEQSRFLELLAVVEYKVPHPDNLHKYCYQFDGFERLLHLLTEHEAQRGKQLFSELLHREISGLVLAEDFRYLYVVPSDRSAGGIATSMYGAEHLTELQLPLSTQEIQLRIAAVRGG